MQQTTVIDTKMEKDQKGFFINPATGALTSGTVKDATYDQPSKTIVNQVATANNALLPVNDNEIFTADEVADALEASWPALSAADLSAFTKALQPAQ